MIFPKRSQVMVSTDNLINYPNWKILLIVQNNEYYKRLGMFVSKNNSPIALFSHILSKSYINSCVPRTVIHKYSLHRIYPKLFTWVPDICPLTNAETIYLSPSKLGSQMSLLRPTLKLFNSIPSRLSFDWHRHCWITSQPSVFWPSQPLMTQVLYFYPWNVTETKMLPFFSTAQN